MILNDALEKLQKNAILYNFNTLKTIWFALHLDNQFLPHRQKKRPFNMT